MVQEFCMYTMKGLQDSLHEHITSIMIMKTNRNQDLFEELKKKPRIQQTHKI
jgi:hypothetical protein